MFVCDSTIGIDEKALRDAPNAEIDGDPSRIDAVGIGDAVLAHESLAVRLVVLNLYADKNHVLIPHLLPGPLQVLGLGDAGRTPGRPEVDEDSLAAQVG